MLLRSRRAGAKPAGLGAAGYDPSLIPLLKERDIALLGNDEVRVSAWQPSATSDAFWRLGDGDALFFVHRGSGVLGTEYGPLRYRAGDFCLVPRTTTFRFEPEEDTSVLLVEALEGRMQLPDRGMLGRTAVYCAGEFG